MSVIILTIIFLCSKPIFQAGAALGVTVGLLAGAVLALLGASGFLFWRSNAALPFVVLNRRTAPDDGAASGSLRVGETKQAGGGGLQIQPHRRGSNLVIRTLSGECV